MSGCLKGVGRVYQQTIVDTYAKVGFAKLYDRKTPLAAAHLLNGRVIPFYEQQGIPLQRVLTGRGTEYCGTHDRRTLFEEPWRLARDRSRRDAGDAGSRDDRRALSRKGRGHGKPARLPLRLLHPHPRHPDGPARAARAAGPCRRTETGGSRPSSSSATSALSRRWWRHWPRWEPALGLDPRVQSVSTRIGQGDHRGAVRPRLLGQRHFRHQQAPGRKPRRLRQTAPCRAFPLPHPRRPL